jgi:hypothetical protein
VTRWVGMAALAASVLSACDVEDTDGGYTEAEFAQDLQRRVCEMIEECGGPECAYPDATATLSTATPGCDFDPVAARACIDEPWACTVTGSDFVPPPVCSEACGGSTTGTR